MVDKYVQALRKLTELSRELGEDYWEQGYTPEDVDIALIPFNQIREGVLGMAGHIGIFWEKCEGPAGDFRGDSDLVFVDPLPHSGFSPVNFYTLPHPFWGDSEPSNLLGRLNEIADGTVRPDFQYRRDGIIRQGCNWSLLKQRAGLALIVDNADFIVFDSGETMIILEIARVVLNTDIHAVYNFIATELDLADDVLFSLWSRLEKFMNRDG